MREHFGAQLLGAAIGTNVHLAEAPSHGRPIYDYAPRSAGAVDYRALVQEVLAHGCAGPSPRSSRRRSASTWPRSPTCGATCVRGRAEPGARRALRGESIEKGDSRGACPVACPLGCRGCGVTPCALLGRLSHQVRNVVGQLVRCLR